MTRVPASAGPHTHAAVLDQLDLAVVSTDVDCRVSTWNARAAATFGWTEDEAVGQPATELFAAAGEALPLDGIVASLRSGNGWQGSLRLRRRDGNVVTAFVRVSPLLDDKRKLIGAVACSTDLADRELSEAVRAAAAVSGRDGAGRHRTLSPREREIFGMLARGMTGEQIAEKLVLSPETIRTHIRNAREKLGAGTRVEAVTIALVSREIEL